MRVVVGSDEDGPVVAEALRVLADSGHEAWRVGLCADSITASAARRWNDASVLALSLRLTAVPVVDEVLSALLEAGPDASEAAAIGRVEPAPRSRP